MTKNEVEKMLNDIHAKIYYNNDDSIEINSMFGYGGIAFDFDDNGNLSRIYSYE